jgi:hypothetical protein
MLARAAHDTGQPGSPDTTAHARRSESVPRVLLSDLAPVSRRLSLHGSMPRLETAVYAALRLDFDVTAVEAETVTRASSGAHADGPRCTALHRGPQRIGLHPHHP